MILCSQYWWLVTVTYIVVQNFKKKIFVFFFNNCYNSQQDQLFKTAMLLFKTWFSHKQVYLYTACHLFLSVHKDASVQTSAFLVVQQEMDITKSWMFRKPFCHTEYILMFVSIVLLAGCSLKLGLYLRLLFKTNI